MSCSCHGACILLQSEKTDNSPILWRSGHICRWSVPNKAVHNIPANDMHALKAVYLVLVHWEDSFEGVRE